MAISLGDAVLFFKGDRSHLDKTLGRVDNDVNGWVQKLGGSVIRGVAVLGAAAAGAAVAVIGGAFKLAIDAAPLESIIGAFEGIAEASGKSSAQVLKDLQEQSLGMSTNRELMQKYNLAASLISDDFANQLPDAMGALGKVAAATGEDMGFMLDSLVRGVGRLSPMILDNLGIQVSLTDAYDEWAAANGRTTDSMTKTEQQMAVMAQVMARLNENTASMPELTGTAQQQWESFKTTMRNLKDEVGLKLLPAFTPFFKSLAAFAENIVPKVVSFVEDRLVPALTGISMLLGAIADAGFGSIEFWEVFRHLVGEELGRNIQNTVTDLSTLFNDTLIPFAQTYGPMIVETALKVAAGFAAFAVVSKVVGFIMKLVTVVQFVIAAFTTSGSVIGGIVTLLGGPVTAIIALVAGVIGLFALAWKNNWGGIRDTLTDVWENKIKPAVAALSAWLGENVPKAMEALRNFWETKLKPALVALWSWIDAHVLPILRTLGDIIRITLTMAFEALAGAWENILKPALKAFHDWAHDKVGPVLTWLKDQIIQPLADLIGGALTWALDGVNGLLEKFRDFIGGMELPAFLQRHSPSPFEKTLMGVRKQLSELAKSELPDFTARVNPLVSPIKGMNALQGGLAAAALGAGATGGMGLPPIIYAPTLSTGEESTLQRDLKNIIYDTIRQYDGEKGRR